MGEATLPLIVERGRVLAYRVLDAADEIVLDDAERVFASTAHRVTHAPGATGALDVTALPLAVELGARQVTLPRTRLELDLTVSARLFPYGAVSIVFEIPIAAGTAIPDLVPMCDEVYDSPALEVAAREIVADLMPRLGAGVRGPHDWHGWESYTVVFVESLRGEPRSAEVLASPELARLLVGEGSDRRLAEGERADVLKHAHSYLENDLVVVDWNSAFVLEPSGSRDIPDMLEIATAQLLELRYYDAIFDTELARIYDEVEAARRRGWWLFGGRYGRLARAIMVRLVELSEFTERIESAVKIVGDFYLSRVYRAAVQRFQIAAWQQAIDRKEELVLRVYTLLKTEADTRRATMLEATIVLLIVFEVLMALLRH